MFSINPIRFYSRFFVNFADRLLQTLLPPACVLCSYRAEGASNLCSACRQELPILPYCCTRCANFLPPGVLPEKDNIYSCGTCLTNPPTFHSTYALFPYVSPVMQLIVKLKFQQQLSHAKLFGVLMAQAILQDWYQGRLLPDVIIPVPLHPLRLRERGFNQAVEIARPIARMTGIPIDIHGVKRIRHTKAQSSLPATERDKNIANAFMIDSDYRGKYIAVLDDVITTGCTVRELCRRLSANGASRIDVWCCARTGSSH